MIWKRTVGSYNHSHKKSVKSLAKVLDIKHRIGQNSQIHRFTDSQIHRFTDSQIHSFTASQLRLSYAQINSNTHKFPQLITRTGQEHCLCAFFTLHRLRKPQRTQRVQRIIKECLTKPLLNPFAQRFACSAVKLKNIRRQRNA